MPPPNLELTFRDGRTGDAGDPYTGLDRFGRLVETLWKQSGTGDARVQSQYGRNEVGGVVWRKDEQAHTQGVPTEDNYYWYDALQQVKERQRGELTDPASSTPISDVQQEEDWTYDATGNWTSYSNPSPDSAHTQTRTQNTANEITQIARVSGGAAVEPLYDPAGNMLTLPKKPGISTEQYDLAWDAWNRLVSVKDGGTLVASYTYDGLTRRLTKTNVTETRHYFYNADWRALEERVEGVSGVERQYTWGLRDRWDLLRRKRSVDGLIDEVLYVLGDYLDPVALVNPSGDVVERYAFDAFGNVRFLAPDYSTRSASSFDWEFLFHGEFLDLDTSLYNYGYRDYSPSLGRWLSRDPIEEQDGTNLYRMTSNRPIAKVDDLGLFSLDLDRNRCEAVLIVIADIVFHNTDPRPMMGGQTYGPPWNKRRQEIFKAAFKKQIEDVFNNSGPASIDLADGAEDPCCSCRCNGGAWKPRIVVKLGKGESVDWTVDVVSYTGDREGVPASQGTPGHMFLHEGTRAWQPKSFKIFNVTRGSQSNIQPVIAHEAGHCLGLQHPGAADPKIRRNSEEEYAGANPQHGGVALMGIGSQMFPEYYKTWVNLFDTYGCKMVTK